MVAVSASADVFDVNAFTMFTSSDSGATWTPQKAPTPGYAYGWEGVASSADGTKLVAIAGLELGIHGVVNDNMRDVGIYLSSDSGVSWHLTGTEIPTNFWGYWSAVASSADGSKLAVIGVGVGDGGRSVLLSSDSGATWLVTDLPKTFLESIAISADGSKMVVGGFDGGTTVDHIFTSTDSGANWTDQPGAPQGQNGPLSWKALASSADGTKLVAGAEYAPGTLYTSSDSGVTWVSTNNAPTRFANHSGIGWLAVASSADGRELVALPQESITNFTLYGVFTLQPPLFAKISAMPQRVQIGDSIQVVVTVINTDTNSVTDVSVDGSITVAGTGGVAPAGFNGRTLALTLAPGATTSFTYLYTATNYGKVNFTASATCTGPGGVVTSPPTTSGDVIIAPKADLMVKTANTNDTTFVGGDEFQQPPPFNDQNWTLRVGNNGLAGYIVRVQNDTYTARTFVLCGATNSFTNWNVQVLSGNVNILNAMTSANGWTTPQLAPGADLDLQVSLSPLSGASVLENKSLLVTVLADSTSTDVLDAVMLHAMLVPVPVQVTLLALNQSGLTPASIQAGMNDINTPLVPALDPALLANQPQIHRGLVADGVTPLVIKLAADPTSIGQFANGLDFAFQASILGGGLLNGNSINQRLLLLQNGAWQVATDVVLTAASPIAYVQVTPILSDDVLIFPSAQSVVGITGLPELDVDFNVVDNASGVEAGDVQFAVRKPPIALIHGYNTTGDWGDDFKAILAISRPYEAGNNLDNFVCTVKYGQDTQPGLQAFSGLPVYVNTTASLDNCAQMALQEFTETMKPLHVAWAFTRFDVVAHSQGGVLTRMLCSANANSYIPEPFRNAENFYRGRFHRVVTIGSPHNGTRLLHYLLTLNQANKLHSLPQWVGAVGLLSEVAQEKFDPFGSQFAEVNNPVTSAPWFPDPAASFHLVRTVIDGGASPGLFDPTPSYKVLGLALPGGGAAILPRGSDGVVDFDSMGCSAPDNVPPTPVPNNVFTLSPDNDVSHSGPLEVFASAASQTESTAVAQHVIDALDQSPALLAGDRVFGSFPLPPALNPEVETLMDEYASSNGFVILANWLLSSPQPHFVGSNYLYQLVFPTNLPPQGTVAWFVQVYGPSGITTDGVELSAGGTSNSQITVTVDGALVGDVVLSATYVSVSNIVVTTTPTLVVSMQSAGVTLIGVKVVPASIALPIGSTVSPQVVANYSDGSSSLRYVISNAVALVSSQPSVVSVNDPLNWQLSAVGSAQVTLTWSGFKVASQITVFDPAANTPPTLSLDSAGNGQLTLSWPGFTTSYQLESNGDLSATNAWQPVPTAPIRAGGESIVTLSVTNAQQFYRLQWQP